VEQFRRHGFFKFLFLYLWESLRHGYHDNRFEVEARAAETSLDGPRLPLHVSEGKGLLAVNAYE
jgi:hypothetical protein